MLSEILGVLYISLPRCRRGGGTCVQAGGWSATQTGCFIKDGVIGYSRYCTIFFAFLTYTLPMVEIIDITAVGPP